MSVPICICQINHSNINLQTIQSFTYTWCNSSRETSPKPPAWQLRRSFLMKTTKMQTTRMSRNTGSSVSEILSEVSQLVSQCQVQISSSNDDPSHVLPDVDNVLSEINNLVQTIADKQQPQSESVSDQNEIWKRCPFPPPNLLAC